MATTTVPEVVYAEIGRRIEFLRTDRRVSQSDLARRLRHPLTRAAISNMESGRQRILVHVLLEIADALEVDPRELLPHGAAATESPAESIESQLTAEGIPLSTAALVAKLSASTEAL